MKDDLSEILCRLNSYIESIPKEVLDKEDNYVTIYVPNIDNSRDRFRQLFKDKSDYIDADNGNYKIPKQLLNYFKVIMNKAKVPYDIV